MDRQVKYYFEWLKEEYPKLTDYEAWSLALEHYKIDSLRRAFVVEKAVPSALEMIAIQLGAKPDQRE